MRPTGDPRAHHTARELFVAAMDPEGCFTEDFASALGSELEHGTEARPFSDLDEAVRAVSAWSADETRVYLELADGTDVGTRTVLVRRAVLACAPLASISGAWLQWLSEPANADDAAIMSVLRLYAGDVGVGHSRSSRGNAFIILMRDLRLSEYAVPTARLALDARIAEWAFHPAAVLLGLSRRPADFTPEILGADLCVRAVGLLPALQLVRREHPHGARWSRIDPAAADTGEQPAARECAEMLVRLTGPATMQRILRGFGWAFDSLCRWNACVRSDLEAAFEPAYEMAELLRRRAREGAIYHQRFELAGKPLTEWLAESLIEPSPLLAVLAESKLVKPGRAHASSLVNGLVSERGPMFRVFAPEDLDIVRRWIDALQPGAPARPVPAGPSAAQPLRAGLPDPAAIDNGPAPNFPLREAYHGLIRRNDTPQMRRFALEYVHGWLARARSGVDEGETVLPAEWDADGLRPWLLEQHERHGRDFERTADDSVPSRDALIDSTVQLAPLTLIDGSWLQGFTDYEHASSELGSFLFETYWDELGNGVPALNHPLIYREVLAEMGITLPPTGSPEFATWPGFREASFELPVYWLSVGRFPRRFLPEILGLNLAMELSGVGGTYRRANRALRSHGFSTRFVDIHNTIDNVASGHSAWAADAVDSLLSAILAERGVQEMSSAWERVRVGFRSLSPPDGRRARRASRAAKRSVPR